MASSSINIEIKNELIKRGFNRIISTDIHNSVNKFELSEESGNIFNEIYKKPFLRLILQLIINKAIHKPDLLPMNKEDIRTIFQKYNTKIQTGIIDCPDKVLFCQHCHGKTEIYRYNIYLHQKPSNPIRCHKCYLDNDPNLCDEKDDWGFFEEKYFSKFIIPFIAILEENKIISTYLLGTCLRCQISNKEKLKEVSRKDLSSFRKKDLKNYIKNFYCDKCHRFYDFELMVDFNKKQKEFWIKKGGTWFEWYIKNLIKINNSAFPIEQGIQVKNGDILEIDVILLKNNKLISVQCKATNPDKLKFEQVADVIKLISFSDEVYLVTTAPIADNDKKSLLKYCGNKLKIISGKNIENEAIKI